MLTVIQRFLNGKASRAIELVIVIIGGYALTLLAVPRLSGAIDSVSETARIGVAFQIGVVIIIPFLMMTWGFLLVTGKYRAALGFQILLLPMSGRVQRLFGIVAYRIPSAQFAQKISITTFMILVFLVVLLLQRIPMRRKDKSFRIIEFLLWGFVLLGTVSQFVNHALWSAFWLSLGGLWQFAAWFYIISALIRTPEDMRYLMKCIVIVMLLSIAFRILARGDTFLVTYSESISNLGQIVLSASQYVRIGSVTFGPPVYYGGYLALVIFAALYLMRSSPTRLVQLVWLFLAGILFFEMINTFTRGASLSLLAFGLLLLFKNQRRFACRVILMLIPVIVLLGFSIWRLISYTGIYFDSRMLRTPSVLGRWQLLHLHFSHFFDRFGFGYGIMNQLQLAVPSTGLKRPPHNTIIGLSQCVGAFSTLFFVAMLAYIVMQLYRIARNTESSIAAFWFVAIVGWIVFSNTTGPPITYYIPYESVLLMYSVLFSGAVFIAYCQQSCSNQVTMVEGI